MMKTIARGAPRLPSGAGRSAVSFHADLSASSGLDKLRVPGRAARAAGERIFAGESSVEFEEMREGDLCTKYCEE